MARWKARVEFLLGVIELLFLLLTAEALQGKMSHLYSAGRPLRWALAHISSLLGYDTDLIKS